MGHPVFRENEKNGVYMRDREPLDSFVRNMVFFVGGILEDWMMSRYLYFMIRSFNYFKAFISSTLFGCFDKGPLLSLSLYIMVQYVFPSYLPQMCFEMC